MSDRMSEPRSAKISVSAIGFSTITCLPARAAAMASRAPGSKAACRLMLSVPIHIVVAPGCPD